jgi:hypothetical protein
MDAPDPTRVAGHVNDFDGLAGRNHFQRKEHVCRHENLTFEHGRSVIEIQSHLSVPGLERLSR